MNDINPSIFSLPLNVLFPPTSLPIYFRASSCLVFPYTNLLILYPTFLSPLPLDFLVPNPSVPSSHIPEGFLLSGQGSSARCFILHFRKSSLWQVLSKWFNSFTALPSFLHLLFSFCFVGFKGLASESVSKYCVGALPL